MSGWRVVGLIAGVALPFCNIPLIIRIARRKSSKDIGLVWALGVWVCLALMLPSGLMSPDPVFTWYAVSNILLFSVVVVLVVRYR